MRGSHIVELDPNFLQACPDFISAHIEVLQRFSLIANRLPLFSGSDQFSQVMFGGLHVMLLLANRADVRELVHREPGHGREPAESIAIRKALLLQSCLCMESGLDCTIAAGQLAHRGRFLRNQALQLALIYLSRFRRASSLLKQRPHSR
jgi:hypothetical protein